MQLYELASGDLVELTSLPEPVASAHYVPGARRAVLAIDEGGNERHQLYLIDLDDAAGGNRYWVRSSAGADERPAVRTPVRGRVAGRSHARVRVKPRQRRRLRPVAVRPRERRASPAARRRRLVSPRLGILARRAACVGAATGPRPLDVDLVLVDVASGEVQVPVPHPDEAALVGPPAWVSDSVFYASSNVGSEFAASRPPRSGHGRDDNRPRDRRAVRRRGRVGRPRRRSS